MTEQHAVDPIACFLTACEMERREHRSSRREHKVVRGRLIFAEAGRFFYAFDASPGLALRDDTSVQVIIGGMFYQGTVYSRASFPHAEDSRATSRGTEQTLTVALQADLGLEIPSARIEGLEQDLLQCLIAKLRAVKSESEIPGWNAVLANRVIALSRHETEDAELIGAGKLPDDLTSDQVAALSRCLSQSVTYLWGPPGTGKTVALAALALKLFQDNKRVLIVSHTNHAVDGVLESLCKRITERGRSALPEGSILRVGTMVRESFMQRFGAQVHLESVMDRNQDKVSSRLSQLKRELAEVRDGLFAVTRKITLLDAREQLLRELDKVKKDAKGIDASFVSAVRRLFSPEDSSPTDIITGNTDTGVSDGLELLSSSVAQISREIDGCDHTSLNDESVELSNRQLEITEAIAVLEKFIRDLRVSLLDRARIVATTATQAMLSANDLHMFDAVLIDEASMLPLPLCFLLSGLARERVVVAGDFRQLPAIAMSDAHMVRQWYSRDVFECAGIVDLVDSKRDHPALVVLTTQFRSNQTLCSLINSRFYSGILKTASSGDTTTLFFKDSLSYLNQSPVVFVDTSSLKPWGEQRSRSKSNLMHALIVRKIALLLSTHGIARSSESIGIIAPYRQQSNLIGDLLVECCLGNHVSVGTVHKFQGSERDTIILDLTEGRPLELGSFFTALSLRETGARLLNVALSRARKHLFVVADLEHLRAQLRARHVMSGVLDDLVRIGYHLPVEELIGEHLFWTPSEEVKGSTGMLAFQAFDEDLFLPGLVTDLLAAQDEVVFSSPTLTRRVARVIGSILEQRIQSGLRVTLRVSATHDRNSEREGVLRDLRQIGVVVVGAQGMIPPAAIIDSEVVWLGSIAPFDSIAPTAGLMTRCVSARSAYHALELLEAGEVVREAEQLRAFG
jgi:hypothetical protein